MDVDFAELICDRRENRLGVALFEFGEDDQRFHVRPQIEKILGRDLSGHDDLMNFVLAKKLQQPAQLSDPQPLDDINMFADRRIGFIGERGRDDFFDARFARSSGEDSRINAIARDDSENL